MLFSKAKEKREKKRRRIQTIVNVQIAFTPSFIGNGNEYSWIDRGNVIKGSRSVSFSMIASNRNDNDVRLNDNTM